MTVTQTTFVSRINVPSAVAATSSVPAIPAVDRFWEPQSLFIHDWSIPCRVSSAWQTIISRSRTGSVQRNGISDKPKVNAYYQSKCFNQDHWRNLKEMMSKQEVCKYASPLHSDACYGVTLFDPQVHRFLTTSSLATRRLFAGQHAFIANQGESSMWDDFTLARASDVNRSNNRITFDTPLRAAQYSDPKIDTGYTLITGKNPPPAYSPIFPTYWGYASGVNVTMWAEKSWTSGNPIKIGGYNIGVTGVNTVRLSRAFAVLIKPDDQIVHIAYTMCKNNQSITLEPARVRAVQGSRALDGNGQPTENTTDLSVVPTWTTVLDWTESGTAGGSSTNQPTGGFSHQRVSGVNPTNAQIRTTKVVIKRTTVTKAMCDTLSTADVCGLGDGQFAVVVEGEVVGSAGTSTTSDNSIMQAVIVVRDGFVTPIGGSANLVAALDSYFMGHVSRDTPAGLTNKDYPVGTVFPSLVETVSTLSNAPKSKMIAVQVMTYGNATTPLPTFTAPLTTTNAVTPLYPSAIPYPNSLGDSFSVNQAKATSSTVINDVSVQINEIFDTRTQEEPATNITREFRFTSRYAANTPAPSSAALTPFMFSIGLLLNPTIKKPLRIYPAIEADASPPQMSSISAQTSTIGTTAVYATQTSGKPALDSPDVIRALMSLSDGWDTAIYPKFQSNPTTINGCNAGVGYAGNHIDAPLLIGKFDYASGMVVGIGSSVQSEELGIGRSVEAYSEKPHKEFSVNAKFLKRINAWKFLELWNNRRGRLMPVWFPSPANSIRIIGASGNEVYLEDTDEVKVSTTHGYKFLYVTTTSGGHYILSINTYEKSNGVVVATVDTTLNVGSTQTCGLNSVARSAIVAGSVKRATSAHLCFFDSDELDEEWITDEVMTASFRLIEHPDFVPDDALGIVDPDTGCGTCCGTVDECTALGGTLTGCPNDPGCCFCKTSNLKLRLTIQCYDACLIADGETNNDPIPCEEVVCDLSGNPCTPSGSKEIEIPLHASSTCSNFVFLVTAPATCFGNAVFQLNLDTAEWTVSPGHLLDPCCAGSGCQCPNSGCPCLTLLCGFNCGDPVTKSISCTVFEYWDKACSAICNPEPNCQVVKCGQASVQNKVDNCCGGVDPVNPTLSVGRKRITGLLFNDWGDLGESEGCSGCAGCS